MGSDVFAQGGSNKANQGIAQANNAANAALCASGALKGPACNNTSTQANANSGSNTAGQTAGGGASGGGTNTANQGIGQTNTNQQFAQCVSSGSLSDSCKGPNAQCVSAKNNQVQCDQEAFDKLINSGKSATANLTTK
jgi:hypothetical protein